MKPQKALKIGILGAVFTLIGDLLIGAMKFPEGADMIQGYLATALAMPTWRPIAGGLIGFLGICMEFFGLITVYPLIKEKMPKGAEFYKLSIYAYLAMGGGAVHLPCGVFMWLYKAVTEAAGQTVGYDIALKYVLYFLLPVSAVFMIFFFGANMIQFIAFLTGKTPFPKWYCIFNLLLGKFVFNAVRQFGNTALINGIGTSNMSLGAIVMFTALLIGWNRYVLTQNDKYSKC